MSLAVQIVGLVVGVHALWWLVGVLFDLLFPAKVRGRSFLYAKLKRVGIGAGHVSHEVVNAAIEVAKQDATDPLTGEFSDEFFCGALEAYARAIHDKLKNLPLDASASYAWKAIEKQRNLSAGIGGGRPSDRSVLRSKTR